jgi:hypothetical protein
MTGVDDRRVLASPRQCQRLITHSRSRTRSRFAHVGRECMSRTTIVLGTFTAAPAWIAVASPGFTMSVRSREVKDEARMRVRIVCHDGYDLEVQSSSGAKLHQCKLARSTGYAACRPIGVDCSRQRCRRPPIKCAGLIDLDVACRSRYNISTNMNDAPD